MANNIRAMLLSPTMSESYRRIRDVVEDSLEDAGVTPVFFEKMAEPGVLVDVITDAIKSSNFIVADVSDNNGNVLFELGFAYALGKPALLMMNTKAGNRLPLELGSHHTIFYSPDDLKGLKQSLARFISYQASKWKVKEASA